MPLSKQLMPKHSSNLQHNLQCKQKIDQWVETDLPHARIWWHGVKHSAHLTR